MNVGAAWGRGRTRFVALVFAAAVSAAAGCTPTEPAPPVGVLGRLGGVPPLGEGAPEVTSKAIGRSVRQAVPLAPDTPLELPVPVGSRRMLFSAGGQTLAAPRPIELAYDVERGGRWVPLGLIGSLRRNRWYDGVVDLPADASAVRFTVTFGGPGGARPGDRLWLGGIVFAGERPTAESPPNVLLVSLDTLGARALSAYGGPEGVSPNLDRLLSESRTYRRAFAPFGNTLISHGALFSGIYPDNSGILSRYIGIAPLRSLVHPLASAGFVTLGVTENGFVGSAFGFADGYDHYDDGPPKGQESAAHTLREALRVFERYDAVAPLFLFVHTYEVHNPYTARDDAAAEELLARLSPEDARLYAEVADADRGLGMQHVDLPERDVERLQALYWANLRHLDRLVGDFVMRLERLDPDRRTLVILTSDHGEEFEPHNVGHGGLDNDVLHVPLAFHWPGEIEPGTSTELVELIDVLPTALELAGLAAPSDLDGRSLVAEMRGEHEPSPDDGFAIARAHELPDGCSKEECRRVSHAVQNSRFKLVRDEDGALRLYDLESDAEEVVDVSAQHPDEVRRLLERLDFSIRPERERAVSAPSKLDAVTLERLRALGYVD